MCIISYLALSVVIPPHWPIVASKNTQITFRARETVCCKRDGTSATIGAMNTAMLGATDI